MNKEIKYCLNCNNKVYGEFCSKCGQSIHTSRVNTQEVFRELGYGLFHLNSGLFYTTKELLLRPAVTIRNYLSGKRVGYIKPFIFLIVCGVIYSFVFHLFHFFPMDEMNKHEGNVILEYVPIYKLYSNHYSSMLLVLTPFYALFSYLLFYRRGYNYMEHLVMLSYLSGARIFVLLLFYPFIYLSHSQFVYLVVNLLAEIYFIWGLSQFFKRSSWFAAIFKVLLLIVLAVVTLLVLVIAIFLVFKYYHFKL
ncbi:conserved membrane hypothetical protein [uncultured Dysgonomonas sp.]|uniref:DUF3667 domain-containing protein n=1 Tax=uncultured Dysgonomonas sp. TaxID=206096 RepID=A0A212JPI4_9BACT|nr:DUF3667 domain-containing protein [uncultured Dysgonomonas sp.]SBW01349.1 conserved membrane hypothetical protein [uncultured Dysgonomonas sp.]